MDVASVTIFGTALPLWAVFLISIIAIVLVWKLIKFAIKVLLVIIVFFLILFGLDVLGIFDSIQGIISGFI